MTLLRRMKMTSKEALGILEHFSEYSYTYLNTDIRNKLQEALKVAIKSLEQQNEMDGIIHE